jgi:phosphotransferase system  glucose/maltose/N-acetylglucosamine-specific IIC component
MGFEDHFENRDKHYSDYREDRYHTDRRPTGYQATYSPEESNRFNWFSILDKIRNNNKLKLFVLIAGLLVLTIAIVLIIVLLPLIMKLINSISQIGVQGILKEITSFIESILKGTKN